jgi:hypothetical protein
MLADILLQIEAVSSTNVVAQLFLPEGKAVIQVKPAQRLVELRNKKWNRANSEKFANVRQDPSWDESTDTPEILSAITETKRLS